MIEMTSEAARQCTLGQLGELAKGDWGGRVYFGARPYLDLLCKLQDMDDGFGVDDAKSIVTYFLINATTWRGRNAAVIKGELRRRLKETR